MKKYEMTSNVKEFSGHKLYQIRALKDFGDVKVGNLGGYIEKEENLSHDGNAQVYRGAQVFGNAQVYGETWLRNNAWIFNDARISNKADYICFGGFGSENGNITMFRTKNKDVYMRCNRFSGSLKEFEEIVKETYGDTKYAKEYLTCIEVAKIHFEIND